MRHRFLLQAKRSAGSDRRVLANEPPRALHGDFLQLFTAEPLREGLPDEPASQHRNLCGANQPFPHAGHGHLGQSRLRSRDPAHSSLAPQRSFQSLHSTHHLPQQKARSPAMPIARLLRQRVRFVFPLQPSSLPLMPTSKPQIRNCLRKHSCLLTKAGAKTHVRSSWECEL